MSQGIQIWDAAGNLVLDGSTRIGNILGIIDAGTTDGYIENNLLGLGTPFWSTYLMGNVYVTWQPEITVALVGGNWRLSWHWPYTGNSRTCKIVYGVV